MTLSTEATEITLSPMVTPPMLYTPFAPLLPAEATTTIPFLTMRLPTMAEGVSAQFSKAEPMLRFTTCMPSL